MKGSDSISQSQSFFIFFKELSAPLGIFGSLIVLSKIKVYITFFVIFLEKIQNYQSIILMSQKHQGSHIDDF